MSRHSPRSAGDHINAVAQVSEQMAKRDARIAELEAEVEQLKRKIGEAHVLKRRSDER